MDWIDFLPKRLLIRLIKNSSILERLGFLEFSSNVSKLCYNVSMGKKLRPLGAITGDLEPLLLEMVETHDLQWSEVLNIIRGYLEVHCPDAREEYTDGGHPEFYYGPKEDKK